MPRFCSRGCTSRTCRVRALCSSACLLLLGSNAARFSSHACVPNCLAADMPAAPLDVPLTGPLLSPVLCVLAGLQGCGAASPCSAPAGTSCLVTTRAGGAGATPCRAWRTSDLVAWRPHPLRKQHQSFKGIQLCLRVQAAELGLCPGWLPPMLHHPHLHVCTCLLLSSFSSNLEL